MHPLKFFTKRILLICITLALGIGSFIPGQASAADRNRLRPSSDLISPNGLVASDGTLNIPQGMRGTLNLAGWKTTLDPSRGVLLSKEPAPTFIPVPTVDLGAWSSLGDFDNDETNDGSAGAITNSVTGIAINTAGEIYIVGYFLNAWGNDFADYIAKWDGTIWSSLGDDVNGAGGGTDGAIQAELESIAIDSSDNVYVGGWFTDAAGIAYADYIAMWNGTIWSALADNDNGGGSETGASLNPTSRVYEIVSNGTDIYVGGVFGNAGGVLAADYFAKWNGTVWSNIGDNGGNGIFPGTVRAIVIDNTDIYVGGSFIDANGNADMDNVAKWNGSAWSALGNDGDISSTINGLAVDSNGNLYAAGNFLNAGGNPKADKIAMWNGSAWTNLGDDGIGGGQGPISGTAKAIVIDDNDIVYVGTTGGEIAGIASADYIARWDGSGWKATSSDNPGNNSALNSSVFALYVDGNDNIYVGGPFDNASALARADYFAKYTPADFTITTITSSPSSGNIGVSYSVSVSVTNSVTVTGTVDVDDGDGNTCEITLSGGAGTCNLTSTSTGDKIITAYFDPDLGFVESSDTASILIRDQIFADGFESGNISAWSSFKGAVSEDDFGTLACKLCVTGKGPLVGSKSLKVKVPNNKPHFVQDDNPTLENEYYVQFNIKVGKSLKMGNLNNFKLLLGKGSSSTPFFLQVRKKGKKFQIRAATQLDNGKKPKTKWVRLPKKNTLVALDWKASSGANNGFVKLYINNTLKQSKTGLDNDKLSLDLVRWGVAGKFKASFTITGSFKLDGFDSDRAISFGP